MEKIKCIATKDGKTRTVFLPSHLANDPKYMRRNGLFKDEIIEMEAIGKVKTDNTLFTERVRQLADLGFTKDHVGDYVSPDGFTILLEQAISITPHSAWDKQLERFYNVPSEKTDVSHETDGIPEFNEEIPVDKPKKGGRPKKA